GSSRLGYLQEEKFLDKKYSVFNTLPSSPDPNTVPTTVAYTFGSKRYEISDWLGNVRAVITDKKLPHTVTGTVVTTYRPEVVSVTDYEPFGMEVRERSYYKSGGYRFGFGGHEKNDEVLGSGNIIDMGDRWLDARIGRTSKIDRKASLYPHISPYVYAGNNPLRLVDPDGQFLLDVHQRITQNALRGLWIDFWGPKYSSFSNVAMSLFVYGMVGFGTIFSGGVTYPDWHRQLEHKAHFDNMYYEEIIANMDEINTNLLNNINKWKRNEISIIELGFQVGQSLHAIQDFYSHSNYIELYTQQYGEQQDVSVIPTLEEVLSGGDKYSDFRDLLTKHLKTGKYPGEGIDSHKELNKDVGRGSTYTRFVEETANKTVTYFSRVAETIATKASRQFLDRIKKEVENK
ncbi:MAG: hypothetical protein NZM44_06490, partial [Candidatus Calescibacterium sp.]|nr:hypothetical protein [Candidatus Calescibacterium sp.]